MCKKHIQKLMMVTIAIWLSYIYSILVTMFGEEYTRNSAHLGCNCALWMEIHIAYVINAYATLSIRDRADGHNILKKRP
jgi:high-affinity K+ transport system ATPase subunit B